jgi:aminoglycoside 6'-N-acetyltransferase I
VNISLKPSNLEDASIFKNLYPLYLHDLSAFHEIIPNQHGILEPENPDVRDLVGHGEHFDYWYKHDGILFPHLIWVDDMPAGFVLVSRAPWVIEDVDVEMREFFLLHAFRGRGIAQIAALEAFKRFPGRWGLRILPRNARAIWFWKKTVTAFAGEFTEGMLEDQVALYFDSNPT